MQKIHNHLTFLVDGQRFALPLDCVKRVIHVIEMHPLPKMPNFLHGIINLNAEIIPVINIHFLFSFPKKEIELSDQLIIVAFSSYKLAILVDKVQDIINFKEEEIIKSDKVMYEKRIIKGIIHLNDGMVLINDVEQFLSSKELKELESALKKKELKVEKIK